MSSYGPLRDHKMNTSFVAFVKVEKKYTTVMTLSYIELTKAKLEMRGKA